MVTDLSIHHHRPLATPYLTWLCPTQPDQPYLELLGLTCPSPPSPSLPALPCRSLPILASPSLAFPCLPCLVLSNQAVPRTTSPLHSRPALHFLTRPFVAQPLIASPHLAEPALSGSAQFSPRLSVSIFACLELPRLATPCRTRLIHAPPCLPSLACPRHSHPHHSATCHA